MVRLSDKGDGLSASLQVAKAGEHLVCAELLLQGWNAFLSDAGLPYDVIVDTGNKLYRLQVKSTCQMLQRSPSRDKSYVPIYRFSLRHTSRRGKPERRRSLASCDYYAFVALDRRLIAFMPPADLQDNHGTCKLTLELKSRAVTYNKAGKTGVDPAKVGRFIEDYATFNPEVFNEQDWHV